MNYPVSAKLRSLVIFRSMLADETVQALLTLSAAESDGTCDAGVLDAYCAFASSLLSRADGLPGLLTQLLFRDDNIYVSRLLDGKADLSLEGLLDRELSILGELAAYDGSQTRERLGDPSLAVWRAEKTDFITLYRRRMERIATDGYGVWANYTMFALGDDGSLCPVAHPDGQRLDTLYGYAAERAQIIANTEALLDGRRFNNVLLYGDAGTGKSSTVKALANEFRCRGLRLIELKKKQLYLIPGLIDSLCANPLKFILFLDDLTFSSDDRDFCTLKAILEGGISARGSNIAIYATSNHRHLIKETASDRQGDEISIADKMQELVSLSARFGLTVTFQRPDRPLYSEIVASLAYDAGVDMDAQTLITRAEAFAIRHGGRNPRTAKQFVDLVASGAARE